MSKVLVVSAGFDPDGGGRAAAGRLLAGTLAELAAERGLAIAAVALGTSGSPIPNTRYCGQSRLALARAVVAAQLAERNLVLAFDLLGLARTQPLVPQRWRRPYLLMLHGIEAWPALVGLRGGAAHEATVLMAVSFYTSERAHKANPNLMPVPVHLSLVGSSAEVVVAEPLEHVSGAFRVLIVGRLAASERYKGHDELLAALALLASGARRAEVGASGGEAIPQRHLELVVAGDGDDRPRLEARARELGVADRVHFTGFVAESELAALYREADAFAMPSTGEGFGLVFLEAMRAGLPCVALADTAPAEIVVDGETGLLVPAGDVPALAAALQRLAEDPHLARRLGAAGRDRERHTFSRERFAAGLAPLLDHLLTALGPAIPSGESSAASSAVSSATRDSLSSSIPRADEPADERRVEPAGGPLGSAAPSGTSRG